MVLLAEWLKNFLRSRNLDEPDGRDLYRYRGTRQEYEELGACLRVQIRSGWISSKVFWAGFVLFGAMCISFESEDGEWEWEQIFEALEGEKSAIPVQVRSDGIVSGAIWWKLQKRFHGRGHAFIGFLKAQAGIPIKAFINKKSWAYTAISIAVRLQQRYKLNEERLREYLAEELIGVLPTSFDINLAVGISADAAIFFDRFFFSNGARENQPCGENSFEDSLQLFPSFGFDRKCYEQIANLFKNQLQDDGVKHIFRVKRYLSILQGEAKLHLQCELCNRTVTIQDLAVRVGIPIKELAGSISLTIGASSLRLIGTTKPIVSIYASRSRFLALSDRDALGGLTAKVRHRDHSFTSASPMLGASPLGMDVPTIFIQSPEEEGRWDFYGSGSRSVPTKTAILMVPTSSTVRLSDNVDGAIQIIQAGYLGLFDVWLIDTSVNVAIRGDMFPVKLNSREEKREFFLKGEIFLETTDGVPIYRGLPDVMWRNPETGNSSTSGYSVRWSRPNGTLVNVAHLCSGVYCVTARDSVSNHVLWKYRCVLLPGTASIEVRHATSENRPGRISLVNWNVQIPEISSSRGTRQCCVPAKIHSVENSIQLECPFRLDKISTPEFVITIHGEERTLPFQIKLIYPQRFAVLISGNKVVERDTRLSVNDLLDTDILYCDEPNLDVFIRPEFQPHSGLTLRDVTVTEHLPTDFSSGRIPVRYLMNSLDRAFLIAGRDPQSVVSLELLGKKFQVGVTSKSIVLAKDGESGTIRAFLCGERGSPLHDRHTIRFTPIFLNDHQPIDVVQNLQECKYPVLPKKFRLLPTPWMVDARDSKVRPVFFLCPESGILEGSPLRVAWSQLDRNFEMNPCAAFDAVSQILTGNSETDLDMLLSQLNVLGVSSVAKMPLWKALDRNRQEALALAIVLDCLHVHRQNETTIVLALTKAWGWRWELSSSAFIERTADIISGFVVHQGRSLGGKTFFESMLLLTNSDFCQENKIVQEKMLLLVCRCLWHYLGSSVTGEESELQDIMMIAFTRLREGGSGERVTNYSWIEYIKRGTGTVEVQKLLKLWREDPARQFSFREMTKECWVPSCVLPTGNAEK